MERAIQAILSNVSAIIHGHDFLHTDTSAHALTHWTRLHNAFPHAVLHDTPARIIDPTFVVDAHHQYRFVFGDLLCFPLQDHERLWKFDVKNDIGFYVGDEDSVKGGSVIYMPYNHTRKRSSSPDIGHPTFTMVLQATRHSLQPLTLLHAVVDLPTGKPQPPKKTPRSF